MSNIINNILDFSNESSKKKISNMSIKQEGKVNFVYEEEDEEENEINDLENIKSFEYSEEEENNFEVSHIIYQKNSIVDIESMPYIPFIKIKKISTFLNFFGKKKNNIIKEIKYLFLFDKNFLYMIKMTLKENNQNNFYKRIGNHYDLYNFKSIKIIDDDIIKGFKKIILIFRKRKENIHKEKIKELHMDYFNAGKFIKILKYYLRKLNIDLNFSNEDIEKIFGKNNKKINSLINNEN